MSSEETETPYNEGPHSLDGFLEDLCDNAAKDYPYSPPTSVRFNKKNKDRVRRNSGKKSQPKVIMAEKNKKPRSVVGVIKERYGESNALFSGLSHVDSDADLERDNSRESKEKRRKDREDKLKSKTRQHEIYVKRHSEDVNTMTEGISAPMGISTPVVPVKLDGSGRFTSFQQSRILPVPLVHPERVERRPAVSSHTDCPKERLTFYKTFQALINMGSHGKKNKEERILAQRQKSSDEQMYMNCIWIGIQAWLNGVSPADQDQLMQLEREQIPIVLESVMNFKVQFPPLGISDELVPGTDDRVRNRDSSCSMDTCFTDVSQTYHSMALTAEMIEQQKEAVNQVQKILDKLDRCEQLFPTSHSFAREFSKYKDADIVRRIDAMYLWLNTTKDLCHKLNVLGQVFNITTSAGFYWPFVDFNNSADVSAIEKALHRTSIPEIVSGGDDEEENDDLDVYDECDGNEEDGRSSSSTVQNGPEPKRVSFRFCENIRSPKSPIMSPKRDRSPNPFGSPPDSSTPLKGHFSSSASLSRASSEASLDDITRLSVYRAYVEKGLKKMGLNKMLVRLRDILYRSLQRARQSLEQPHLDADGVMVCEYTNF